MHAASLRFATVSVPPGLGKVRPGAVSALVCLVAILSAGCGGGASEPSVTARDLASLSVRITVDTLRVSQAAQATAEGRDPAGKSVEIGTPIWSSSALDVARVSPVGVVTATGVGLTTITATVEGKQGEVRVHVVQVPVSLVSVSPTRLALPPGATTQLSAVAMDAAGRPLTDRKIAWLSSDPARAAVSSTGMVSAITSGLVSINAISEEVYASVDVRVSGPPGRVATVILDPPAASLSIGTTLQLGTTLEDADGNVASDRPITWSSSAPAVASVAPSGLITALAKGAAQIEALSEGRKGLVAVTVVDPLDAIKISAASPIIGEIAGDTLKLAVSASGRNVVRGVHARVASKETDLTPVPTGFQGLRILWVGTLDLSDVPFGPYSLVISATDQEGNIGIYTVPFKRGAREGDGGAKLPPRSK